MTFKQKVYMACLQLLEEKTNSLQIMLIDLKEGAGNEVKSSAGDKHETSRAMAQLEQEKIGGQLSVLQTQRHDLLRAGFAVHPHQILTGSLIKTNNGYLYLAIPLGKIKVDDITVFALSSLSPLGLKLLHLKPNEIAEINGVKYLVEAIE